MGGTYAAELFGDFPSFESAPGGAGRPEGRDNKGRKEQTMNMKYMEKPTYETVDVVAKTTETVTGTVDRNLVGRALITLAAGFSGRHQVVGGDGAAIRTVEEIGEGDGKVAAPELFVRLVGDIRSLASFKFFKGYVAENPENPGVTDLFTENVDQAAAVEACAERMCDAHPECDGRWEIVDGSGKRYFLRLVTKSLTSVGRIDD